MTAYSEGIEAYWSDDPGASVNPYDKNDPHRQEWQRGQDDGWYDEFGC